MKSIPLRISSLRYLGLIPKQQSCGRIFFRSFASQTGVEAQSSKDYCVDLVHRNDYESYLAGLLFPKEHRAAYFAIKAFNVEMATIRDQIPKSAVQAGKMRFQFWKDILESIKTNKSLPKHINQPVAMELAEHINDYNLTIRLLERSLEAR